MSLILTKAGLDAYGQADATGIKLQATHMAIGDGDGAVVAHTSQSTELVNETWRDALQEIKVAESGEVEFTAHVPITVGGWWIREVAIYADAVLLAIGSHPETWKPDPEAPDKLELVITAPVKFENAAVLNMTVDTTKVLASQDHVAEKIVEHDEDEDAHAYLKSLIVALSGQLPANATTTVRGIVELATNAETTTGTDTVRAVTPAGLAAALAARFSNLGTASIAANAMKPCSSSGASDLTITDPINGEDRDVKVFGVDEDLGVICKFALPDNYDGDPIKARVRWSAPAGSVGDDVGWLVAGGAYGDGEAFDQALGASTTIADAFQTIDSEHVTGALEVTLAGAAVGAKSVRLKLMRDVDYGATPLAGDVYLEGVDIQWSEVGPQTAWEVV